LHRCGEISVKGGGNVHEDVHVLPVEDAWAHSAKFPRPNEARLKATGAGVGREATTHILEQKATIPLVAIAGSECNVLVVWKADFSRSVPCAFERDHMSCV
jgi:hypothetical protein